MSKENEAKIVSRRTFLKKSVAIGASTAALGVLAGCATGSPSPTTAQKWDKEVDVVIIGGGGAGLTAAIAASNAGVGKSILILEKAPVIGGSTSLSGGVIQAAGTKYEAEYKKVTDDTPEKHFQFYTQAAEGYVDSDLVKLLTTNAPAAIDWMVAQGLNYVNTYAVSPNPMVDEALRLPRIHVPGGDGTAAKAGTGAMHIAVLNTQVKKLGIEVMVETPALGLVYDAAKGVIGVKAQGNGKNMFVKANKAVIIATCSFDHNKDMAKAFSQQQLWELTTGAIASAPTNTGDGIKMAMAIGADVTGMGGTIGVPFTSIGTDALSEGVAVVPGIWVNVNGVRFVNEATHYAYAMRAVFNQQSHIGWAIFDDKIRSLGGKALGAIWGGWSDDLKDEIAKGTIVTANTIEDLAKAIGVNAAQLSLTLKQWSTDAKAGTDTLFQKKVGVQAIETAPFFAQKVTSWNLGSCGGLKINPKCQVMDVSGAVIPHLYAAGMAAGGFIGPYYPGSGTAILSTVVLGRIAGENSAKETV